MRDLVVASAGVGAPLDPGPGPRLLVLVEDDPDHAELVARALEAHGPAMALVHLRDGESALRYLARAVERNLRPDLVLLDVRLPGIDGVEVCRRLRADERMAGVRLVLLTTADVGSGSEACDDPATTWAVKPVDGDAFRRLIGDLVREAVGPGAGAAGDGG
jgi:two-component system response regulator